MAANLCRQPYSKLDAVGAGHDVEMLDVIRALDNAFRQAEADREISEIGGRRHDDGNSRAIIDQCHRAFLGNNSHAPLS
jgi:hypothetical protein